METATVGDVIVIPSVTNELGGPVGEAVIVDAVLLQRLPPGAVVTGQNMTLAVDAAIIQLSHWPPLWFVEYEMVEDGVTVHSGPSPVAQPLAASSFESDLSYELDKSLQSLGWIEHGAGVGYAWFGSEAVMVFVQATVEVYFLPREVDVWPTTRGWPSQRVMRDVTFVDPGLSRVSVKELANVEVVTMSFSHCQSNDFRLQVLRASAQLEAYSNPVPVVAKPAVSSSVEVPLLAPSPEAMYPPMIPKCAVGEGEGAESAEAVWPSSRQTSKARSEGGKERSMIHRNATTTHWCGLGWMLGARVVGERIVLCRRTTGRSEDTTHATYENGDGCRQCRALESDHDDALAALSSRAGLLGC